MKSGTLIITAIIGAALAVWFRENIIVAGGKMVSTIMGYPANDMSISSDGLELIKRREGGFQARSYVDATGRSIGYGHFILPYESFDEPISEAQATELLLSDVGLAEAAVQANVEVQITQAMYDALVSFAYNAGTGAFRGSTLLRLLNSGDYRGAAEQFAVWNKATIGGVRQTVAALVARRDDERQQFNSGGVFA